MDLAGSHSRRPSGGRSTRIGPARPHFRPAGRFPIRAPRGHDHGGNARLCRRDLTHAGHPRTGRACRTQHGRVMCDCFCAHASRARQAPRVDWYAIWRVCYPARQRHALGKLADRPRSLAVCLLGVPAGMGDCRQSGHPQTVGPTTGRGLVCKQGFGPAHRDCAGRSPSSRTCTRWLVEDSLYEPAGLPSAAGGNSCAHLGRRGTL
jgi:hypothetical protein